MTYQHNIANQKTYVTAVVAEGCEPETLTPVEMVRDFFEARAARLLCAVSYKIPRIKTKTSSQKHKERAQNQTILVEDIWNSDGACSHAYDDQ